MASVDAIRNNLIEKLLTINNKDYLNALLQMVNSSIVSSEIVKLSEEQKLMLQMSDEDVKRKRYLDQKTLDKEDLKWLKGL